MRKNEEKENYKGKYEEVYGLKIMVQSGGPRVHSDFSN